MNKEQNSIGNTKWCSPVKNHKLEEDDENMKWNAVNKLFRSFSHKRVINLFAYIKLIGSFIVGAGMILAVYINSYYLFLSVLGFAINMYSEYFSKHLERERSELNEKYEFVLYFTLTVVSTFFICFGFMIYVGSPLFLFGIVIFVFYLWKLILSLLYKLISSKTFTVEIINTFQLKILLTFMIITEFFFSWSIIFSAMFLIAFFAVTNFIDLVRLFVVTKSMKNVDENIMTYDFKTQDNNVNTYNYEKNK